MKTVAFLWWEEEVLWSRDKPFSKDWKCQDYAEYTEMLEDKDVKVVCGEYRWYSDGKMEKAFHWNGEKWEKVEDEELDGVYDLFRHDDEKYQLKKHMKEKVGILNDPKVAEICQDKMETYGKFSEYMPETRKASEENVRKMLEEHGKVIVKPRYGSSGEGITIIESLEEFNRADEEDLLVQEFIGDAGIPELGVEGPHDLRILIVNDEIVGSYLRIPGEGSELSNVAQGGSKNYLELEDVPENVREIVDDVSGELRDYRPVVYTVDFMMAGKPYVVELNSQPGVYYHGPGREESWERPWMKKVVEAVKYLAEN